MSPAYLIPCRFEKLSGVDKGADGYVKHWEVLRGVTGDGTVSRHCAQGGGNRRVAK